MCVKCRTKATNHWMSVKECIYFVPLQILFYKLKLLHMSIMFWYYTVGLLCIPFLFVCCAKLRAQLENLRRLSETQTKDLVEKTLHIQELEEKETAATENVIFLLINLLMPSYSRTSLFSWNLCAEYSISNLKFQFPFRLNMDTHFIIEFINRMINPEIRFLLAMFYVF